MGETSFSRIGVAGSGAMGRGIAQLFAQAGIPVTLFDLQPAALDAALAGLQSTFGMLAEKGKLGDQTAHDCIARIKRGATPSDFADCDLVIEAIVERLDVKREFFQQLESIVTPQAVLASNTSSLSITAIAAACKQPQRVAGYHFFNPVPLMKIVEVIGGPRTDPAVLDKLVALARHAGHRAVIAQDTPGFIVNHAGRGFGTEALKLLGEGVADVATIDRIMREQVDINGQGFKLGPFELLDLTGLDVSHPVMESIYRQYYEEPRYRPSVIGAQRVAAGLVGRKTGEGFYRYPNGQVQSTPEPPAPAPTQPVRVWLAAGNHRDALSALVEGLGGVIDHGVSPAADSLLLVAPFGRDASSTAAELGLDASRVMAIDCLFPFGLRACKRRVLMCTPATRAPWKHLAHALFAADGAKVSVLADSPGFVAQRIVAMIVSIGTEIAQQAIASPEDIDDAVRIGLGYPAGPLAMGDAIGAARVHSILAAMAADTLDPRYRTGPWLRRRAQLGLSLRDAGNPD